MSPFTFLPKHNTEWESWVYFENHFSKEECEDIIEIAQKYPEHDALVGGRSEVSPEIRTSVVRWISWNQDNDWIFTKLTNVVTGCNNIRYNLDLVGMLEHLQFTQYFTGGHYRWHCDFGSGSSSKRKLSVVCQLTDPDEYEGGNTEFFDGGTSVAPKGQGSVIIFPSFMQHRVIPVTKGTRFSLVCWMSGPTYR